MCSTCQEGHTDGQGHSADQKDPGGIWSISSFKTCIKNNLGVHVFKVNLITQLNVGRNCVPDGISGGSATFGQLEILMIAHQQYCEMFISEL